MSRLTKKYEGGDVEVIGNEYKAIQKLGKLEDIEDELGCPLDVVLKALKDGFGGVEYKVENETVEGSLANIYYSIGGCWMGEFCPRGYILGTREQYTKILHLKDYKKTWWLKGRK